MDTIAKNSSNSQCRKIPEGIRIRLENCFHRMKTQKKTFLKLIFCQFFFKSHVSKSTPNAFFLIENINFFEVKRYTLMKMKILSKKSHSAENRLFPQSLKKAISSTRSNKPGKAKVGAISKAQGCYIVVFSFYTIKHVFFSEKKFFVSFCIWFMLYQKKKHFKLNY